MSTSRCLCIDIFFDTILAMVITYYGAQHYKLQTGDVVISINPVGKNSEYKVSRYGADIALIAMRNEDFSGVEALTYGEKTPFIIEGPGEYEVKKIFIKGYGVKTEYKGIPYISTIYTLQFDSINICFVGSLSDANALTSELYGKIGDIDILFVHVGGESKITPAEASVIARKVQPSVIVPISDVDDKDTLDTFVNEVGGTDDSPVDKLTLKKKDFVEEGTRVVLLTQGG